MSLYVPQKLKPANTTTIEDYCKFSGTKLLKLARAPSRRMLGCQILIFSNAKIMYLKLILGQLR